MEPFGSVTEPGYAALIGDVVRSRDVEDRARLQTILLTELGRLSQRYSDVLPAPLALTRGDEIQGLFSQPLAVVEIVVALTEAIFPERLVFGLGYGAVSTPSGFSWSTRSHT